MVRFIAAMACVLCITAMVSPAVAQQEKVIFDTDIGDDIDDAYALVLLMNQPNMRVLGVTTAFGPTKERAQMAAKLLKIMGRMDVPVYAGRSNDKKPTKQTDWAKGYTGRNLKSEPAVEFLRREIERAPGEITLCAVGPLTNLGDLLTRYPEVKPKIKRIVIMGGSVFVGYGNNAKPEPEWNIKCDVQAARAVYGSGVPLVMAGLEVTAMMQLEKDRRMKIAVAGSPTTDALMALTYLWEAQTPTLFDPVAVAYACGHKFTEEDQRRVVVEDDGLTRIVEGTPNTTVLVKPRKDAFLDWYVQSVAK
jgi:inosine-uridine nucleoside N-ribohydrolase